MARGALSIVGILLLCLSTLFLFFIVLSGVRDSTPLNKTYFLEADTSGIAGARPLTRWTYWHMCGPENAHCGDYSPAIPFGKAWDRGGDGAPEDLVGKHGGGTTSSYYFYMWRFGWVFFLIALIFSVIALFTSLFACFGRVGAFLASLGTTTALVFYTIAVVLMTVTFVKARDEFRSDGRDAHIGRWAFGWAWGGWAAMLLSTLLFCAGIGRGKDRDRHLGSAAVPAGRRRRGFGWGGRGRVKDEYA